MLLLYSHTMHKAAVLTVLDAPAEKRMTNIAPRRCFEFAHRSPITVSIYRLWHSRIGSHPWHRTSSCCFLYRGIAEDRREAAAVAVKGTSISPKTAKHEDRRHPQVHQMDMLDVDIGSLRRVKLGTWKLSRSDTFEVLKVADPLVWVHHSHQVTECQTVALCPVPSFV